MLVWFVATAVATVWYVFRDPAFDHRLLIVGALLPDAVDVWWGGARVAHSLTASVALLAVIVLATSRGSRARRSLLPLAIGALLHLVFDAAWSDSTVFWWPFLGTSFEGARLPIVERGWWSLVLEVVGVAVAVWGWRAFGLSDATTRRRFLHDGTLALADRGARRPTRRPPWGRTAPGRSAPRRPSTPRPPGPRRQ